MRVNQVQKLILRLLSRIGLIRYLNIDITVSGKNGRFKLPIRGGIGFQHLFPFETWIDDVIVALLQLKGGAFVDIGANVGQTLLKFIEHGTGRMYYGFEPNSTSYGYLEQIQLKNSLDNTMIMPIGLSDRTAITEMFLNEEDDGTASIVKGFRTSSCYSRSKFVTVFLGDEIMEQLNVDQISILKIDVEGSELEVLTGLTRTIERTRPYIFCEILPIYDESTKIGNPRRARTDFVVDLCSRLEYQIVRVMPDGDIFHLKQIPTHGERSLCEYVFIPDEVFAVTREILESFGTSRKFNAKIGTSSASNDGPNRSHAAVL